MPPPSGPSLTIIVAATVNNGVGLNGTLPWRIPSEMKYFARGEFHPPLTPAVSNRQDCVSSARYTKSMR